MKKLYFIATLAMALAACTNEEEMLVPESGAPQEISFKALNHTLSRSTPTIGTDFNKNNKIYVSADFKAPLESSADTYFSDIEFRYNSTDEVWTAAQYYPLAGDMTFLAYSTENHVTPSTANSSSIVIPFGDALGGFDDVMYSNQITVDCKRGQTAQKLVFNHALAWVRFKVVAEDEVSAKAITINNISLDNTDFTGTLSITGGTSSACSWEAATEKRQLMF